jgi:hypothetical protein
MSVEFWIIFGYLAFVGTGIALAAVGKLRPQTIAPLGELLTFIMSHRITRIALFMVWWWLGWHFLVGVTVR